MGGVYVLMKPHSPVRLIVLTNLKRSSWFWPGAVYDPRINPPPPRSRRPWFLVFVSPVSFWRSLHHSPPLHFFFVFLNHLCRPSRLITLLVRMLYVIEPWPWRHTSKKGGEEQTNRSFTARAWPCWYGTALTAVRRLFHWHFHFIFNCTPVIMALKGLFCIYLMVLWRRCGDTFYFIWCSTRLNLSSHSLFLFCICQMNAVNAGRVFPGQRPGLFVGFSLMVLLHL